MLTLFGIVLLVAGAILTFAIERQVDGVDLQLVGWILMAGGGASLIAAMVRAAGLSAASRPPDNVVVQHGPGPVSDPASHERSDGVTEGRRST